MAAVLYSGSLPGAHVRMHSRTVYRGTESRPPSGRRYGFDHDPLDGPGKEAPPPGLDIGHWARRRRVVRQRVGDGRFAHLAIVDVECTDALQVPRLGEHKLQRRGPGGHCTVGSARIAGGYVVVFVDQLIVLHKQAKAARVVAQSNEDTLAAYVGPPDRDSHGTGTIQGACGDLVRNVPDSAEIQGDAEPACSIAGVVQITHTGAAPVVQDGQDLTDPGRPWVDRRHVYCFSHRHPRYPSPAAGCLDVGGAAAPPGRSLQAPGGAPRATRRQALWASLLVRSRPRRGAGCRTALPGAGSGWPPTLSILSGGWRRCLPPCRHGSTRGTECSRATADRTGRAHYPR